VRQIVGLCNRVNKGIKSTIYSDSRNFFFPQTGSPPLHPPGAWDGRKLVLRGLSVVMAVSH
jgi:hypothetical protein